MCTSVPLTKTVRCFAREEGFAAVGVCAAGAVAGQREFESWLEAGFHGEMDYLARNVDKRFRPDRLVAGARSVICLAVGYAPGQDAEEAGGPSKPFVARYARGRDYHRLLKAMCRKLMDRIRTERLDFEGRAFVDSAPLAERSLAATAGLGWIGRNGCLIVPGLGSYVVLAEIVCNLELQIDEPLAGECGDCDACVRACPTGACLGGARLDARRCLSYLSMEHPPEIPQEYRSLWDACVFGCDRCQQACPHNRDLPAGHPELIARGADTAAIGEMSFEQLLGWTREQWDSATRGSAVRRSGYDAFVRNVVLAAAGSGEAKLAEPLRALGRAREELAPLIEWALKRLDRP